jgi:homoserine kinase type II
MPLKAMDQRPKTNSLIQKIIEENYCVGNIIEVKELFNGLVNSSFHIKTETYGDVFFRKYKNNIQESQIRFEHGLIEHAFHHGFTSTARVLKSRTQQSYIYDNERQTFYAMFQFLPGEDRYTWNHQGLHPFECESAAAVLAKFHLATQNFVVGDTMGCAEPQIMHLLRERRIGFQSYRTKICLNSKDDPFIQYFLNQESILEGAFESALLPASIWSQMPFQPCHNDFHPGNLKFKNHQVVGLFDFDWSKMDLRIFDVALAITYCCTAWTGDRKHQLFFEQIQLFLESYLTHAHSLSELEKHHFIPMLLSANLYLVNWSVSTYMENKLNHAQHPRRLDPEEFRAYLEHQILIIEWIGNHRMKLQEIILSG